MKTQDVNLGDRIILAVALIWWGGVAFGHYEVPAGHCPLVVMGKDYWPALYKYADFSYNTNFVKWVTFERSVRFDNPAIFKIPAFRDAVPVYFGRRPPTNGLTTYRHFADNFTEEEPDREILTSNPQPEKPLLFWTTGKRNFLSWGERPDLVKEEYEVWRTAHPNALYDGYVAEWDNDIMLSYGRVKKLKDGDSRKANIEKFLGEKPRTRLEHVAKLRAFMEERRQVFYGGRMCALMAHIFDLHLAADAGARYLSIETTNSSGSPQHDHEYRWNVAAMFARGAARQFGTPWEWYIAGYMNGFVSDGRWLGNIINVYPGKDDSPDHAERCGWYSGIEWGQSANVLRRAFYFAYLNGANFTQMEEWSAQFLMWDKKAKKTVLSPRGKLYSEYHDFTAAHPDRGVAYTPVAICVPLAQGYPAWGGYPFSERVYGYTEGDHAVDAVFFTLVPGFERAKAMARGEEHNLHNTPFAAMYDVIAPDVTSQSPERLLEVMKSYKTLVIVGDYPDRSWEKTLAKYESAGGRVIRIGAAEVPPMTKDAESTVGDLMAGRSRHSKVAEIFRGLQEDYFPFSVEGDCLYGANRNEKGWWLWVFNNNGVTKFGDRPEVVDRKAASRIRVSAARMPLGAVRDLITGRPVDVRGGTFEWTVPAGDLAVFEVPDK